MANKKINQLVSKTSILSTDLFGIGDATTGQLYKKTIAELQAAIGGAVISVNGLVGTVVLDTDDIQELVSPTNKWFTDARARGAISLTVTGSSGASTYNSGTGVLNVPTYTLAGLGGISPTFLSGGTGISYNSGTGVISYSGTVYTDSSIRSLLSAGTGISYNSSTGAISYSGTVYTDSSIRALLSLTTTGSSGASTYNSTTGVINVPNYTLAGLGGISLTSLSGGTGITYNNTTGAISYSGIVYTDASVRALVSAGTGLTYNSSTGVFTSSITQYTDALARASISLTTTGTSGASTYNSTTGVLNVPQYASAFSGTTGYHAKFTSSSTIGNSLIYDTGTAIGIGTASPDSYGSRSSLSINGTNGGIITLQLNGTKVSEIYCATAGATTFTTTGSFVFSGGATVFGSSVSSTSGFTAGTGTSLASIGSGVLSFYNAASSPKYITLSDDSTTINAIGFSKSGSVATTYFPSGKLGIGTTTPNSYLHINGTESVKIELSGGTNQNGILFNAISSAHQYYIGQGFNLLTGTGTAADRGILIGYNVTLAKSAILYDGNGDIRFNVGASSESSRITSGGNILMGTTSDNGERLYISGNVRATGTITANSDITLKKNLLKIENALEKVEQINGYTYELKEDDSKRHAGVIAQEIETVLPEIVNKGNNGLLGVEYGNISALLIEAIKEQQTQIKELQALLNK